MITRFRRNHIWRLRDQGCNRQGHRNGNCNDLPYHVRGRFLREGGEERGRGGREENRERERERRTRMMCT